MTTKQTPRRERDNVWGNPRPGPWYLSGSLGFGLLDLRDDSGATFSEEFSGCWADHHVYPDLACSNPINPGDDLGLCDGCKRAKRRA